MIIAAVVASLVVYLLAEGLLVWRRRTAAA